MTNTETNTLSRRGRPRRTDAERYPNGRLREDPTKLPQWNKLRENARIIAMDQRLATQRGKLFYTGQLTDHQFEAANRWADLLDGWDSKILGRRRTPASPAMERLGHSDGAEQDPEVIKRFMDGFNAAHGALLSAGKVAEAAVTRLCRDEAAGAMMSEAHKGLQALAVHFGLVRVKRY